MPTPTSLPPVSSIPFLPSSTQIAVLSALFEPCAALHELALPLLSSQHFDSYATLIAAVGEQLMSLAESASATDAKRLASILNAHPRLGEKKVESAQSSQEQASLNGDKDDVAKLTEWNEKYERTFPGLRYVYAFEQLTLKVYCPTNRSERVFVDGRGRDVILDDVQLRIERGDIHVEKKTAITVPVPISFRAQLRLTVKASRYVTSQSIVLKS